MVNRVQDGLQQISDLIPEFVILGKGTLNTTTATQYPQINVTKPSKLYRNLVLYLKNSTGVTLSNVTPLSRNSLGLFTGATSLQLSFGAVSGSSATGGALGYTGIPPAVFALGDATFQLNLSAAPSAAGTVDWLLIGY